MIAVVLQGRPQELLSTLHPPNLQDLFSTCPRTVIFCSPTPFLVSLYLSVLHTGVCWMEIHFLEIPPVAELCRNNRAWKTCALVEEKQVPMVQTLNRWRQSCFQHISAARRPRGEATSGENAVLHEVLASYSIPWRTE